MAEASHNSATPDASLVSIVIPMYNAEKFISDTLASILREQEIPIEVIVVNDRSTDRSLEKVRGFCDDRIVVVEGLGRGAAAAMNTGFGKARGGVVMFCDADDFYPDGRIRQQVRWLADHPEYDAVCGRFSTVDPGGNPVAEMQSGNDFADITGELNNGKLRTSLCTFAMRSPLVKKVGAFREFFEACYDLDFQLRIGEVAKVAYVPENWYFYRLHASSITHTQPNVVRQFFERTAFEFQRQRQTSGTDDLQKGSPPAKPAGGRDSVHSAAQHIQEQLLGQAWREHRAGRKLSALRTGVRALGAGPFNAAVWKSALALLLK